MAIGRLLSGVVWMVLLLSAPWVKAQELVRLHAHQDIQYIGKATQFLMTLRMHYPLMRCWPTIQKEPTSS